LQRWRRVETDAVAWLGHGDVVSMSSRRGSVGWFLLVAAWMRRWGWPSWRGFEGAGRGSCVGSVTCVAGVARWAWDQATEASAVDYPKRRAIGRRCFQGLPCRLAWPSCWALSAGASPPRVPPRLPRWSSGWWPSPGGGRCAGCWPARAWRGLGLTTGRAGSSRTPRGAWMRWACGWRS
jgi:hypothetical protein